MKVDLCWVWGPWVHGGLKHPLVQGRQGALIRGALILGGGKPPDSSRQGHRPTLNLSFGRGYSRSSLVPGRPGLILLWGARASQPPTGSPAQRWNWVVLWYRALPGPGASRVYSNRMGGCPPASIKITGPQMHDRPKDQTTVVLPDSVRPPSPVPLLRSHFGSSRKSRALHWP